MKKIAYLLSLVFLFTSLAPAAMAKDGDSNPEKKEIRKELREINKEAKERGSGIYISTGAIIIILLLILIL